MDIPLIITSEGMLLLTATVVTKDSYKINGILFVLFEQSKRAHVKSVGQNRPYMQFFHIFEQYVWVIMDGSQNDAVLIWSDPIIP